MFALRCGRNMPACPRQARCLFFVAILSAASACGSTPTTPSPVDVTGLWNATATIIKGVGGDCVGPTITQAMAGTVRTYSIQLIQTGATLTGTVTNRSTGGIWTVSGTVSGLSTAGSIVLLQSTAS